MTKPDFKFSSSDESDCDTFDGIALTDDSDSDNESNHATISSLDNSPIPSSQDEDEQPSSSIGKRALKRKLSVPTAEESFSGNGTNGVIPKKKPCKGCKKKNSSKQQEDLAKATLNVKVEATSDGEQHGDLAKDTLNIKVEATCDGSLLPSPKNPQKALTGLSIYQILFRKAEEGLFNESHYLLALPSQPITGPSLAQTWQENSRADGHRMSELFEMATIEYDPETEVAMEKNERRKKNNRPPLVVPKVIIKF